MTSYSFMGETISVDLIDTVNEWVSEFLVEKVPHKQYEPFLRNLLQDLPDQGTVAKQRRHIRKQCQHFLNQWERTNTCLNRVIGCRLYFVTL